MTQPADPWSSTHQLPLPISPLHLTTPASVHAYMYMYMKRAPCNPSSPLEYGYGTQCGSKAPIRNTQYAIRNKGHSPNTQYAIGNTQYAIRNARPNANTQYSLRNTQYAPRWLQVGTPIRNTQYAIRNAAQSGYEVRNTQYAIRKPCQTVYCVIRKRLPQYATAQYNCTLRMAYLTSLGYALIHTPGVAGRNAKAFDALVLGGNRAAFRTASAR